MSSNYAFIVNGLVTNLIVCDNPSQELLNSFKETYNVDLIIEGTSQTEVGGTYENGKFWKKQPYPSWTKDEELNEWVAPIPKPTFDEENPIDYIWDEENLNWKGIRLPE